ALWQARLACPSSTDAARRLQRPPGGPRRARQYRGLCAGARPRFYRRLQPDGDQSSAIADGLPDEVRQPSPGRRSGPSDPGGIGGGQQKGGRVSAVFGPPLAANGSTSGGSAMTSTTDTPQPFSSSPGL